MPDALSRAIREIAWPLTGAAGDYEPLLERIGDARFVLLGEASHGTHEFYRERAEITRRLIRDRGFTAVAAEADWPDAYRVNRYVRGEDGGDEIGALAGFARFPTWMWRNTVVAEFVAWLRAHNGEPGREVKCGFYGLDLYSLHASIRAVLLYLDNVDPEAARRARYRYGCFEDFGEDSQAYGYAAAFDLEPSCEQAAVTQLVELTRRATDYSSRDGRVAADEFFAAEQNARLVKNAEQYYRGMFGGRVSTWNLRDTHMAETLEALAAHLERLWGSTKVVVWAHNSHLGDARATGMGEQGELNLGQLVRERHRNDAVLVGFTTYTGTVTAATEWDGFAERKRVRPGMRGSYEELFHDVGLPQFLLTFPGGGVREALTEPRLERAIGVIYRPESERISHYFPARLGKQFDAVLHFDVTRAVEPLERTPGWQMEAEREWETFPSAL
ncbi:MAG TPA: erythromycin esterase family protein [Bryobacteraceae bacterium]|nr:erythromycin esterase family protein [Bryobacteraceae bacterium]